MTLYIFKIFSLSWSTYYIPEKYQFEFNPPTPLVRDPSNPALNVADTLSYWGQLRTEYAGWLRSLGIPVSPLGSWLAKKVHFQETVGDASATYDTDNDSGVNVIWGGGYKIILTNPHSQVLPRHEAARQVPRKYNSGVCEQRLARFIEAW